MSYNYSSITYALDKKSGAVIEASQVFSKQKTGFHLRKEYALEEVDLYCQNCDQSLSVVPSKLNNLYFRHHATSGYCELKDETLGEEIIKDYYKVLRSKESFRHKELKTRIGTGLKSINGVNVESIDIDKHFLIRGNERRRPDVYCCYLDKEIAFEIQLSPLSLKYIIHRFNFYKRNGIYLIWVLDNKNPLVLRQMERDIKYLSPHQNLFALDETSVSLKLLCSYKAVYLKDHEVREKWYQKSVGLPDLHFVEKDTEAYYFDYETARQQKQMELTGLLKKEEQERKDAELRKKEKLAIAKIEKFIKDIDYYKKRDFSFYKLRQQSFGFDAGDLALLNNKLSLTEKYKEKFPALNYYIRNYKVLNPENAPNESFVEFLLREDSIQLEVNKLSPDGKTCLQELYDNTFLERKMYTILPALFQRGYVLTDTDRVYVTMKFTGEEERLRLLNYYNALRNRSLAPLVQKQFRFLLFVESALGRKIICSGIKSWVAYIVPILSNYRKSWRYIKLALEKNGAWDLIMENDTKRTFHRKIQEFHLEAQETDYSVQPLLTDLYPELFLKE